MALSEHERHILLALESRPKQSTKELMASAKLSEASVNRASSWLHSKGLVSIRESVRESIELDFEGKDYLEKGLPERRVLDSLAAEKSIAELYSALGHEAVRIGIVWLKRAGAIMISDGKVKLLKRGEELRGERMPQERLLKAISEKKKVPDGLKEEVELLKRRGKVLEFREYIEREIELTAEGKRLIEKGITLEKEVSQLTPELLATGKWKEVKLREYDVEAPAPVVYPGKKHPFRNLIDRMREVFIEMGFQEIKGPIVESCFWNFDALFVPQDHPGRELQDTFYIGEMEAKKPPEKYLENVKKVHEGGWSYKWDPRKALELVLRTHTTATTCRELTKIKEYPVKVFSIDKVFRNEVLDYKHLPEFYQVEGIVVDKNATLVDLFGILHEFYSKLGFEKIRFKPSFFPYTEPSVEPEVYFEQKKSWLELGGAGIFRKEVVEPMGIDANVLAWGLGGERPFMPLNNLDDIRTIYKNSLGWIRNVND